MKLRVFNLTILLSMSRFIFNNYYAISLNSNMWESFYCCYIYASTHFQKETWIINSVVTTLSVIKSRHGYKRARVVCTFYNSDTFFTRLSLEKAAIIQESLDNVCTVQYRESWAEQPKNMLPFQRPLNPKRGGAVLARCSRHWVSFSGW